MILYHGSIRDFKEIDVNKGKGYKDFGRGFYTTAIKSHAESLALRNLEIEKNRNISIGISNSYIAYRYNFNFNADYSNIKVKIFTKADLEWIKFIVFNRRNRYTMHNYDIVIGPTADARTVDIIDNYRDSLNTDSDYYDLLRDLKPEVLPKQYFFASSRAVRQTLKFADPWRIIIKRDWSK